MKKLICLTLIYLGISTSALAQSSAAVQNYRKGMVGAHTSTCNSLYEDQITNATRRAQYCSCFAKKYYGGVSDIEIESILKGMPISSQFKALDNKRIIIAETSCMKKNGLVIKQLLSD